MQASKFCTSFMRFSFFKFLLKGATKQDPRTELKRKKDWSIAEVLMGKYYNKLTRILL